MKFDANECLQRNQLLTTNGGKKHSNLEPTLYILVKVKGIFMGRKPTNHKGQIQVVINARSAIGKLGLPCRWMGGNIKQVALLLRTSGASTQRTAHTAHGTHSTRHTQHTAHSAWHTALTQYTLHNHKRDSTTSITMSVLRTMWLWTHKPITAQIMDGCRLKHLKNGDPVNDAIGEQNPWRQCIHFQFSPFLVVQNFPWAWLLIIGNIPHC